MVLICQYYHTGKISYSVLRIGVGITLKLLTLQNILWKLNWKTQVGRLCTLTPSLKVSYEMNWTLLSPPTHSPDTLHQLIIVGCSGDRIVLSLWYSLLVSIDLWKASIWTASVNLARNTTQRLCIAVCHNAFLLNYLCNKHMVAKIWLV